MGALQPKKKGLHEYVKLFMSMASYAITVIAIYYLIQVGLKADLSVIQSLNRQRFLLYLLFCLSLYVTLLFLTSYAWELILEFINGKKISTADILPIFTQSNIAKYLPGNVFQYVSRNFMGSQLGWRHSDIALSSFLEIILGVGAFIIVLSAMVGTGFLVIPDVLLTRAKFPHLKTVLVFFVITSFLLFWIFFKWKQTAFIEKARLFFSVQFISLFMKTFAMYFVVFLGTGLILVYTYVFCFQTRLSLNDYGIIVSVFTFASFAGYIIPGAPGGIGIRESILVLMLSSSYGESTTLMASLIQRILSILGDIVAFGIGWFILTRTRKQNDQV